MKRLMLCFLLLACLVSCKMAQPEYYDAGYFHPVQPRAEIYGFDERPHDYRHPNYGHRTTVAKKATAASPSRKTRKQAYSS